MYTDLDYLSLLESVEAPTGVADDFPDAMVMVLTLEEGLKDDPDGWLISGYDIFSKPWITSGNIFEGRVETTPSTELHL
jgi:hypothetical protein